MYIIDGVKMNTLQCTCNIQSSGITLCNHVSSVVIHLLHIVL